MLINTLELLSDAQAITVDAISTKVYDSLPNGGAINSGSTGGPTANTTTNLGAGKPKYLYVLVDTAFTTGDAGVLTVTLESDDNTSLSSATVHATYAPLTAAATLVAGYWICKGVPIPSGLYQRYVGLRYLTTTGDMTAGKIMAWLSDAPYSDEQYRSGITTGVN
jgi:hypothetical protein